MHHFWWELGTHYMRITYISAAVRSHTPGLEGTRCNREFTYMRKRCIWYVIEHTYFLNAVGIAIAK